jgi:serine protease Do
VQPQQPVQAQQPVQPQQTAQPQYYSAPASRSPFANSPYAVPGYTYQRPVYTPPVTPPQSAPKEKKGGFWKTTLISAGVAIICCAITAASISAYWQQRNHNLTASFDEKLEVLRQEIESNSHIGTGDSISGTPNVNVDGGLTPAQVYAKNAGSVVAISCKATETEYGQIFETESSGSGFILTKSGYIASNYHVVSGADSITVTISDGKEYAAQYIGGDESNDIALLKVEATDLQPVTIGSSDALIVGDQVAAIGNPLGELTSTLTVGYISAKDRVITTDGTQINMLQTDAAINSGNSGGPLFNMKGEVIGITTAKYSGTTNSGASIEGIGFAIPIDDVIGMLEDLRDHGYVKGAYLGVSVSNVDAVISQTYGLPMGVLVHDVVIGGAAQKGGVKSQDIIVNLGGYDIENMNDLTRALRNFEAGQTVTITVYRNGGNVQLSLTLDEKPRTEQ